MLSNEKALIAVDAVCCHLRNDPGSYDQGDWGNGTPDCETPGCIAGHLVAATKIGREGYERRTRSRGADASDTQRGDAIRKAATEALGLEETPRLFEPEWPREWLNAADLIPEDPEWSRVEPSADTALAVLGAIMDGDLDEALAPSKGSASPDRRPSRRNPTGRQTATPGPKAAPHKHDDCH